MAGANEAVLADGNACSTEHLNISFPDAATG